MLAFNLVLLMALIMGAMGSPANLVNVKNLVRRTMPLDAPLQHAKRSPTAQGKPF